ncbi:hypothetical protein D9758_000755 [Tetrapyrgos nigripes]|uniref:Uncharacterized protein n=1 Tax=Tetrapyrgos nigripes TaxID=182062 RepID=A0A8H5GZQ5_9AGAR|nr:hypothetical protein D9758_000755 [Tetrapyrgos nigripes]
MQDPRKYVQTILTILENKREVDEADVLKALKRISTEAEAEEGEILVKHGDLDVQELLASPLSYLEDVQSFHPGHDGEAVKRYAREVEEFVSRSRKHWIEILSSPPSASKETNHINLLQATSKKLEKVENSKILRHLSALGNSDGDQNAQIDILKGREAQRSDSIEALSDRIRDLQQTQWGEIDELKELLSKHEWHASISAISRRLTEDSFDERVSKDHEDAKEDSEQFRRKLEAELDEFLRADGPVQSVCNATIALLQL